MDTHKVSHRDPNKNKITTTKTQNLSLKNRFWPLRTKKVHFNLEQNTIQSFDIDLAPSEISKKYQEKQKTKRHEISTKSGSSPHNPQVRVDTRDIHIPQSNPISITVGADQSQRKGFLLNTGTKHLGASDALESLVRAGTSGIHTTQPDPTAVVITSARRHSDKIPKSTFSIIPNQKDRAEAGCSGINNTNKINTNAKNSDEQDLTSDEENPLDIICNLLTNDERFKIEETNKTVLEEDPIDILCDLIENDSRFQIEETHEILRNIDNLEPQKTSEFFTNLANIPLSEDMAKLLNKGLSFSPTPKSVDTEEIARESKKTTRRIRIKDIFFGKNKPPPSLLPIKSKWTPYRAPTPYIENYCQKIQKIYKNLNTDCSSQTDNISKGERKALKKLRDDNSIVIKKADKGSNIVLMPREGYIKEAYRQLNNTKYYKKLEKPRYQKNILAIKQILRDMKQRNIISDKEFEFLLPQNAKARQFYGLPKIHKEKNKWVDNFPPLRPITSDCGSESYNIALYVDKIIKPLAQQHPSFLRDTWDFLDKISEIKLPEHTILISCDVESLYTNIPLLDGIKVVRGALDKRIQKKPPTEDIIKLLEIQAYNNDFEFNNETFLQIHGTAMGKRWAPSFADLYMANWEEKLKIECQKSNIPFPKEMWFRFLDDIFAGWVHDIQTLQKFQDLANSIDPFIKITIQTSSEKMDFLDTTIFKGPRFQEKGILDNKSYGKPTDTHQYLHANSYHPPHTHKGLVKGMFIRLRRLNNNQEDFLRASKEMFQFFLNRGYKHRTLRSIFSQVRSGPYTLECYRTAKVKEMNRIPAVITYNKNFKKFPKLLAETYDNDKKALRDSEDRERFEGILQGPCLVAYKRTKNLKDILVQSKLPQTKKN